jgi:hypothetical protein
MGTCAVCTFGNLHVIESKSEVDPELMKLFRFTDRQVRRADDSAVPAALREHYASSDDGKGDCDKSRIIYYEADPYSIRDRLNIFGYTLDASRRLFDEWRCLEVKQQESRDSLLSKDEHDAEVQRLRDLKPDRWMAYIRTIAVDNLTWKDAERHKDSFLGTMLQFDEAWYGYGGSDWLVALRLAVEACLDLGSFVYDLTDLVDGEFINVDDDDIERVIGYSAAEFHARGRVIILTEGRSDTEALAGALDLLYPHLRDYYSFMDFAEFGGGNGQLANLVRALAGAGVVNRVIALFDNDASSRAAMRVLKASKLPGHIIATRLPDLPALGEYPTIGPSGPALMDINGMAASIELYFGLDTLATLDGTLAPIQWTGYERSVETYQGELLAKSEVQARFRDKLARARVDPGFSRSTDWSGMRLILTRIFTAFNQLDERLLSSQLRYIYREEL